MTRKFIEGFEGNDSVSIPDNVGASIVSASGLDMSGNYCFRISGAEYASGSIYFPPGSDYYFAFKIRFEHSYKALSIQFRNSGTTIGTLRRNASSYLFEACHGSTLISGGTGVRIIQPDITYLIEVHYRPATDSTGIFDVKVNGSADITLEGVVTADGSISMNNLYYWQNAGGSSYLDDLVIDDADWIGNTKIQGQFVTGAGNTTGLTPTTGANYSCVDEIPFNDDDYVYGNTVGLVDTYGITGLTEAVASIKCVQVSARMAFDGAPTPTKQDIVIRPVSTDRLSGSPISTGISFARYDRIWELNPETSNPFLASDCNAMEIGSKLVA
jgi:hypothetical protein